jgi:hypothetical protein
VLYTITETDRNVATITSVSTTLQTDWYSYYGSNCTVLGPQTCYNYNQTASCTGTCTETAIVCYDPYFPACASLFSAAEQSSSIGSSLSYWISPVAVSYYCDTQEYGLQWLRYGYWPSTTAVYTITTTIGSDISTFTPTPVPFSRTQASRPASIAQEALLGPTATSGANVRGSTRQYLWALLLLVPSALCCG